MNNIDRFSLLMLEPGEIYFCDNAVTYRLPQKDSDEKEGWEVSWFEEEIKGRLKICSKSLVFDPRTKQIPLIKFPLKHCINICIGETDDESYAQENSNLEITSDVTVEMLENNIIKPYKFRRKRYTHGFHLNFAKVSEVLPLIHQLQRASTLPTNDHNFMIEAIVRSLQNRITFNYAYVKDCREQRILEIKTSKVTPLVTNPGRILVTDVALYYQPFNNIEKEPVLRIPFTNFKRVIKRRYLLRHVGLEILYRERFSSKYLYLIFKEHEDRDEVFKCLMQQDNLKLEHIAQENITYKWQTGLVSNYDYLLYLNSMADRSVNDLTQYPVFPWVIAEYVSKNLDLNNTGVFRDLKKPVGALCEERLQSLKDRYKDMPEPKFLYGSHYSTPGFVLYYLVREHPLLMLCLQNGKFDHPDRMFNSLLDTWRNVTTNQSDFKELVPEFYDTENLAEFLTNAKTISFGTRQNGEPVWDVALPPWAKSPVDFITKLRTALESEYVSYNLHHWIDLIFGYKQKGEEAVKADNVFYHLCYEGAVDLSAITDLREKISVEVQIMEFGQIPKQVFTSPHPQKFHYLRHYNDEELLQKVRGCKDNRNWLPEDLPSHIVLYSSLNLLANLREARLHRNAITHIMFTPDSKIIISLARDGILKAYNFPSLERFGHFDSGSLAFSSCVHLLGTTEVIIGSWDNYLYRFNYTLCQKRVGLQAHCDAVTCMDINSEVLVTGSWDSLVRVWDLTKMATRQIGCGWSNWRLLMDHLICQMDHDGPVNCLVIHPHDEYFASATTDGFINMWHLRKDLRLINVKSHNGPVNGLVWSPDGESLLSCGEDGKLILVEANLATQISSFSYEAALKCLLWDGRIAVVGAASGSVIFIDMAKSEVIHRIYAHEGSVTAICLSPDKLHFVTGGEDRRIVLWGCADCAKEEEEEAA